MSECSKPIIVEESFDVPRQTVWEAVTERDQMIQWFFDSIPDFKAEIGFETRFAVYSGHRRFSHLWKITEVVPGQKLVIDWRYEEYPGAGAVTFEVTEGDSGGSRLSVTNEGLETFPQDVPEFAPESCEGGWKYFIQGNLKSFLEPRR